MTCPILSDEKLVNVNVGVIGHVDSGKTALCRVLTEVRSTASLDKHPQSLERGITLDLGLSSFRLSTDINVTLVDCPGHASLVRTVLGAARIIDMCLLVVDAVKGIQTQTAECIVLAEVMCGKLMVVLNKVDMLPVESRDVKIQSIQSKLSKVFSKTKFGPDVPIVSIAANPGGNEFYRHTEFVTQEHHFSQQQETHQPLTGEQVSTHHVSGQQVSSHHVSSTAIPPIGIAELKAALTHHIPIPERDGSGNLLFMFDHCFAMKGQGAVLTGTMLSGSMKVGDQIDIAGAGKKKVKSIQMFKQSVNRAIQGDRIGVCVTGLDTAGIERGIATDEPAPVIEYFIGNCKWIQYFRSEIESKSKFHITIAHSTVIGQVIFYRGAHTGALTKTDVYQYCDALRTENQPDAEFVLIKLEKPVIHPPGCLYLASKLDLDIHAPGCRLAFHGQLLDVLTEQQATSMNIIRHKSKQGVIERSEGNGRYIVSGLLKKDSDMSKVIGSTIKHRTTGIVGTIEGPFGKSGKLRAYFKEELAGVEKDSKGVVVGEEVVVLEFDKRIKVKFH